MKFLTSTFVTFVLIITSSTFAIGQKTRPQLGRPIAELKRTEAPVEFAETQAFANENGVLIRWRMKTETDNIGFQVVRVNKDISGIVENKFVSSHLLSSRSNSLAGEEYQLLDPDGTLDSEYVVESYQHSGGRIATKPFGATYVSSLGSVASPLSDGLYKQRNDATGRIANYEPAYDNELQGVINENVQVADPANQRWVAAQPGVKLGIRQAGMYRVTRAQLQAAGFDVNSDQALWQLYTDGVEQAILVGPNGDYIDFYARGIDTVESDTRMYYLVVGPQAGKRMGTVVLRPGISGVRVNNFDQSLLFKERFNYLLDIINGEAENYFGHFVNTANSNFTINLPGADNAAGSLVNLKVKLIGYSSVAHAVNVTLNGTVVGQATGVAGAGKVVILDTMIPASLLVNGNNIIGTANTTQADFNFFDSVEVTYKRNYVASQNNLAFTMPNYKRATVSGFTSANVRLFDTTFDGEPMLVLGTTPVQNGATFDLNIPAYRNRAMYAVEDSALRTPASIAANGPSTLSTAAHNGQMVIITHRNFRTQANQWAEYRRSQGTAVEVVDVDDIFDEFNYGVLSANSIRDFLNFAKSTWQTPPQYVLLIGDGSYDSRNYEGTGYWNLIPAKMYDSISVATAVMETTSDDALADFNNDGLAEIAIGRIPARSTANVTTALNATMKFETLSATENLSRGAVLHYDNPSGWDFLGTSQVLRDQLPAGTPTVLVPRSDANPNATFVSEVNNGRYLVNFAGHGTLGSLASAANFSSGHVSLLTNANRPSVFTMLTCLTGYFHNVGFASLSEFLIASDTAGIAAAWASSGETTPDIQTIMGARFYGQVAAGPVRIGDLIIDAKTVLHSSRDVQLSWVLIGDPMLKMR